MKHNVNGRDYARFVIGNDIWLQIVRMGGKRLLSDGNTMRKGLSVKHDIRLTPDDIALQRGAKLKRCNAASLIRGRCRGVTGQTRLSIWHRLRCLGLEHSMQEI